MSIYALAVIILAIAFEAVLANFAIIRKFLNTVTVLLSPFFIGFFIAYILNPMIRFLEKKIFIRIKFFDSHKKIKRTLSLLITYLITFTLIIWFISYLIPEILNNIFGLFKSILPYINSMKDNWDTFFRDSTYYDLIPYGLTATIEDAIKSMFDTIIVKLSSLPAMITSTFTYFVSGTMQFASRILDLVLGIIISIYVIADKEKFAKQSKKVMYTLLKDSTADKAMKIINDSNKVFEGFLVGKIIDSSIIGVICFAGLTLSKTPYTLLISLIVGITNMIPYFGPFIGAGPAIIITLAAAGPLPAVWVAIFILILQQFDGNILGPKILGDSTGLSPFWIIFSITIGGALAGVIGMFLGVPIFAVIYNMFSDFINKKHEKKIEENINTEG